jgi:hypothetical protein
VTATFSRRGLLSLNDALAQRAAHMSARKERPRRCRSCDARMRVDIYIAPCGNEPGLIVYACPSCGAVDTITTEEIATLQWKTSQGVQ